MKSIILTMAAIGVFGAAQAQSCVSEADEAAKCGPQAVSTYILLDRTGSMSGIWNEALGSVNAYARSVSDNSDGADLKTDVTVAVFDAQDGLQFDVLRQRVEGGKWIDITNDEANPRGMTPLYDAIGRIVSLAETDNPERAVIVIMTDGEENSSREFDNKTAKVALDRVRERGWEVVFLGAEFANFGDADAVGVSGAKSMAVDKDQLGVSMERLARKSRDYGAAAESAAPIEFDDEDRAVAGEDEVKSRNGNN